MILLEPNCSKSNFLYFNFKMASDLILHTLVSLILCLFVLFSIFIAHCDSFDDFAPHNTFTVSSLVYPHTRLQPFQLRYFRVELPPWFSSVSISLNSDVDLDITKARKIPKRALPIICFREGSPPLPDASNTSIIDSGLAPLTILSIEGIQGHKNLEQCYPMQQYIELKLTNEQIPPGVWYFGLFNGIGSSRTQSKMVVRGSSYSFTANVTVEGCSPSTMFGQYCNHTVDPLSCSLFDGHNLAENILEAMSYNQTGESLVACRSTLKPSCLGDGEPKIYYLDVEGVAEELTISATNVRPNLTQSDNSSYVGGISLTGFTRLGAIPSVALHDYSSNLNTGPLIIRSPKVGRWYISIIPINVSKELESVSANNVRICYSMESYVLQCPYGKTGPNCAWNRYFLQAIVRRGSSPFESYFMPITEQYFKEPKFAVEPLLSNSSNHGEQKYAWTYFVLDVPRGASGGNINFRLSTTETMDYEVYARFGGLPSLDNWDYCYKNQTSNSGGSTFLSLCNSSNVNINFHILYASEGTWVLGLRHPINRSLAKYQTIMSVMLERCPNRCSSHGRCDYAFDASGAATYSYCSCDRNHGGFDCSVEIVNHRGHVQQSIALVVSNAAAIFPAFWALRQKALAEWVLFTSSGISSGLYHACDVGTWCPLSFKVLQFMDFWLSFMAVVSTFVYLATIDEVYKRVIHTVVAILTALMAITNATRSSNITIVLAIGALGLLIGWLIELLTKYRSFSFPLRISLNVLHRWESIKAWGHNLLKTLYRRYRWGFMTAGFTALAMAAISWKLETTETYWIWHSIWHLTIYTSSFFFLCSKERVSNVDNSFVSNGENEREGSNVN
ncbi:uncharacterized protein LOC111778156 isoform X1 [Cucurbita pepo subsp. pepo]|uniref:uncharacterized protein LOC111778156 isoform X1 n=1 Tax=Cucurbita pepo subsp. pepo TaxID=3664 RepID=UPI000C9D4854|nr:uncharacterized protein LOC111778156 isoform X1 [Cucurbita pepo subsp. pepo]